MDIPNTKFHEDLSIGSRTVPRGRTDGGQNIFLKNQELC